MDTWKRVVEELEDNRNGIIKLLQELVKVPTYNPPGKNFEVIANMIAREMEASNCKVELFEAPESYVEMCGKKELGLDYPRVNVVGSGGKKEGKPTIVFNAHSDVVPVSSGWTVDPVGGEIKDGKVYGRGAADNKSGIVSMVSAFKALHEAGVDLDGHTFLTSTVDEELGGFSGLKYLLDKGLVWGDFGVSADSGFGRVTFALNGRLRWRVTTYGKSVHSSMAQMGINAIEHMAQVVLKLQAYSKELQNRSTMIPTSPDTGRKYLYPIASVGTIHGGIKDNIVPDRCYIDLDRRVTPEEKIDDARNELRGVIEGALREVPEAKFEVSELSFREPCVTPPEHSFVKRVKTVAEEVLGTEVPVYGGAGSSDMQYLINEGKMPACGIGPIRTECRVHGVDEFVYIDDVIGAAKVYARLALDMLTAQ